MNPKPGMPALQIVADDNIPSRIIGVDGLFPLVVVRGADGVRVYRELDGTWTTFGLSDGIPRYLIVGRDS